MTERPVITALRGQQRDGERHDPIRSKSRLWPRAPRMALCADPPGWRSAQTATCLRDVRGTRLQVPVNQRPAGSREGYVWLPKWIRLTNFSEFESWDRVYPHVIGSPESCRFERYIWGPKWISRSNSGARAAEPAKMPRSISVHHFNKHGRGSASVGGVTTYSLSLPRPSVDS